MNRSIRAEMEKLQAGYCVLENSEVYNAFVTPDDRYAKDNYF